jgi:hypothetical protein
MSTQLQNLSNTFNTLLNEYTTTYKKYIDAINSNDNSLTTINNTSFVGKTNISLLNNVNIDICKASCSSNSTCSGATFNNNSATCDLVSGSGDIVPTSGSTSIVKQAMSYSYQLQQLNNKLMDINKQMMDITEDNYNKFEKTTENNNERMQILQNNYETLTEERREIADMISQYETLNTAYENGSMNVTSNYYKYIVFLLIAIFLVILLLNFSSTDAYQQRGGGKYFNLNTCMYLVFLAVLIVFNASIKK